MKLKFPIIWTFNLHFEAYFSTFLTKIQIYFQANIVKSKIYVHHRHVTMVVRVFHYLAVILNVIAPKDSKERHVPKMLKNVCLCHANMVELVATLLDLISK